MNRLPVSKRAAILRALTEGNSVRATARLVGVSKTTVLKLLVEAGEFCAIYQDHTLRNLPCTRIQADEIWAFCGAKARNAKKEGQGDIWTYTAICRDTKLVVTWLVGPQSRESAHAFMHDLASRLPKRVSLSTDGHRMYAPAVESAFGWNGCDYGQVVKQYQGSQGAAGRYSPPKCIGAERMAVMGAPAQEEVCTSHVERQNLNTRLYSRRHTRLTNAFSKKTENHAHAMALHFMAHNFCRPHTTLTKVRNGIKTTPAMAAGLTDRVWKMEDVLSLMDPTRMLPAAV